jgi:hypothetical protein
VASRAHGLFVRNRCFLSSLPPSRYFHTLSTVDVVSSFSFAPPSATHPGPAKGCKARVMGACGYFGPVQGVELSVGGPGSVREIRVRPDSHPMGVFGRKIEFFLSVKPRSWLPLVRVTALDVTTTTHGWLMTDGPTPNCESATIVRYF